MIVQESNRCQMKKILEAVTRPDGARFQHGKKAGVMILLLLAASLLTATPVGELADRRITLAARIINAPL